MAASSSTTKGRSGWPVALVNAVESLNARKSTGEDYYLLALTDHMTDTMMEPPRVVVQKVVKFRDVDPVLREVQLMWMRLSTTDRAKTMCPPAAFGLLELKGLLTNCVQRWKAADRRPLRDDCSDCEGDEPEDEAEKERGLDGASSGWSVREKADYENAVFNLLFHVQWILATAENSNVSWEKRPLSALLHGEVWDSSSGVRKKGFHNVHKETVRPFLRETFQVLADSQSDPRVFQWMSRLLKTVVQIPSQPYPSIVAEELLDKQPTVLHAVLSNPWIAGRDESVTAKSLLLVELIRKLTKSRPPSRALDLSSMQLNVPPSLLTGEDIVYYAKDPIMLPSVVSRVQFQVILTQAASCVLESLEKQPNSINSSSSSMSSDSENSALRLDDQPRRKQSAKVGGKTSSTGDRKKRRISTGKDPVVESLTCYFNRLPSLHALLCDSASMGASGLSAEQQRRLLELHETYKILLHVLLQTNEKQ